MKIRARTLKNGLRVLVSTKRSLESVGIVVGVRFGSVDVNAEHRELAHCLEHMLFKGTKRRNWADINNTTRKYNIYYNAETDYEMTLYEAQAQRRYVTTAMDLMSDMIRHPTFKKKEFRHEMGPVLHELAIRKEDPDSVVFDNMPRALFIERNWLRPSKSGEEVKKGVTLQGIRETYDRYYNPGNMVLAMYGSIDEEEGFELARKYFGDFERAYHAPRRRELKHSVHPLRVTMKKKDIGRGEVAIGFGCSGIGRGGLQEYVAMRAVASLLSNRLWDQIREMRGLSYDPSVEYDAYGTFGYLAASAGAPPAALGVIRAIMLSELRKFRTGRIRREELDVVKRGLGIKQSMSTDDALGTAIRLAGAEIMYGDAKMLEGEPAAIRKLDVRMIKRVLGKYMPQNRYGVVMLTRA